MFSPKINKKVKNNQISDCQSTINEYESKNNKLLIQIADLKTTLNLNQEILYNLIEISLGKDENIQKLLNQSKNLWEKNQSLIDMKFDTEKNIAHLQKLIEKASMNIRDEVNNILPNLNKKRNELIQKENAIKKLKIDLEKARKSAFFKTARMEIFVTGPTKSSVELNQVLINAKTILNKATKEHSKEKKNSENMKKKANNLREKMNNLKNEAINIFNKININKDKKMEKDQNIDNYLKKMNYNELMENDEQEYEEEENEESEESSDDGEDVNKKSSKAKEKEYNNLNDQYNKIKNEIESYQKKINYYKKIYKDLNTNIKENTK